MLFLSVCFTLNFNKVIRGIQEGNDMIYQNFQDLKLSALGLGAMRLPVVDGNDAQIDVAATEEMVAYAMELRTRIQFF